MHVFDKKIRIRHTPANPSFLKIKVGVKGVYISWIYFSDAILLIQNIDFGHSARWF